MNQRTIFCDSKEAILEILKTTKRKIILKTNSPSLTIDPLEGIRTIHLDKNINALIPKLISKVLPLTKKIYEQCLLNGKSQNFSSLCSMHGFKLFNIIKQIYVINKLDFNNSTLVVNFENSDEKFTNFYSEIIERSENNLNFNSKIQLKKLSPNRLDVFKVSNCETIEYFFWKKFWKILPKRIGKGSILINRESHLLYETTINLTRMGFAIKKLSMPQLFDKEYSSKIEDFYIKIIKPIVNEHISFFLTKEKQKIAECIFKKKFLKDLNIYEQSVEIWNSKIEYFKKIKTKALFDSFVVGPVWHALSEVLRKNKILICSFQHGHNKEFCDLTKYSTATFGEMVTSDLFFCYSNMTNNFIKKNVPYSKSKIFPVGIPKYYTHKHNHLLKGIKKSVFLYLSTCVHSSHTQPIVTSNWSDKEKTQKEIFIVENILSKIKHSCIYKTYPVKVYPDNEQIEKCINKYNNIFYFDSEYDLMFLKNHAQMIITSRATSTLGWCMATSMPLIYINYKSNYCVTNEFKSDARDAIFFFEAEEKDFQKKIVTFLNQPIKEIKRDWYLRKKKRKKLWLKYFTHLSENNISAGRKAASRILENF